ncbi:hypothetical protein J3U18_01770 [Gilliamella sp. B3482]|uniref:hypothetical protein n=1 Tax=Gilliamella sp. B3482 TaxID=2817991 RepID=UPI00226A1F12|nr:hypothetical protein [Gilliamella sp. B3482]MCX8580416.1 hypothetical protein [Gilliamella sp. B3482]
MKNLSKILVLLFSVLALSACSQKNYLEQGTPLSHEKVDKIVEGSTTEVQLLHIFGQPASKVSINANESKWTYTYLKKSSTKNAIFGETQYDILEGTLEVVVNQGVVTWFNYSQNNKQKKW